MNTTEKLQTESAIQFVKSTFSGALEKKLNLTYVSAPMIVQEHTGINDDLNGVEQPVSFPLRALSPYRAVVVHSLAKWKRMRLKEYGIEAGKGIWTDMRALRPDEELSPLHSVYVDQWDWEKHITESERTVTYLQNTVEQIYEALKETERQTALRYPFVTPVLRDQIHFIHAETLLQQYPDLTAKEREAAIARKYGAVFIMGIGGTLSNGEAHDGRAADYDDWSTPTESGLPGLNGDIILWHPVLECAFEVSSMGIRVNPLALVRQLKEKDCTERSTLLYHKQLLSGQLPQSMGGGIGQSRICMFMLRKKHIGEVQVSIWPEAMRTALREEGVYLL